MGQSAYSATMEVIGCGNARLGIEGALVPQSGSDGLQGTVNSNGQEILVVMQQLAVMLQCCRGNDAVIGFADSEA